MNNTLKRFAFFKCNKKMLSKQYELEKNYNSVRLKDLSENKHDFHYFWLRHNCSCFNGCRHPKTKEKIINTTDVDLNIKTNKIKLLENELRIEWSDGHSSIFPIDFLLKHTYSVNRKSVPIPHHKTEDIEINYNDYKNDKKSYLKKCADNLKKYGLTVVRNRGLDTEEIISEYGGNVISTHFGRIEDLRTDNTTNKNTDQLGYTNSNVDLHTDQPFLKNPPGMQLL